MKVTKITIGRLHNLGYYEHIRYELTCDVAEGESPAVALIGMERILDALNPRCPHATHLEIERKIRQLDEAQAMNDDDFARQYGHEGVSYKGTRSEYLARMHTGVQEEIQKRKAWDARHAKARKLLEDLGGAANWKDHKLDWEDSF